MLRNLAENVQLGVADASDDLRVERALNTTGVARFAIVDLHTHEVVGKLFELEPLDLRAAALIFLGPGRLRRSVNRSCCYTFSCQFDGLDCNVVRRGIERRT